MVQLLDDRLLEALKHLLWTDDESRHVETALEDAFKSRASLGANWLINVGGTFICNALPLFRAQHFMQESYAVYLHR